MAKRKPQVKKVSVDALQQTNQNAAGIVAGAEEVYVVCGGSTGS